MVQNTKYTGKLITARKSPPRQFYKWNLSYQRKNCWSESTCAFSFSLLTFHMIYIPLNCTYPLHMSPICHNLFTITLRCPKVFVSLLTTSVSASHCAEGKCDHWAHFSKGQFLETESIRRIRQKQINATRGNCFKLSCCYTRFPFFPKLARLKAHLVVRQDCATEFHSLSVQLVRKRRST